jgi:probable H4MPT-linked C1 transfer pathway protein
MTASHPYISGWDIGGAHIKVARCNSDGVLINVIQLACPLWQGIDKLELAIKSIFLQLNNQQDRHAITMTGELVDIFANRQQGVAGILSCLANYISTDHTEVYAANLGWLSPQQASSQWQYVASRNWQASASLVAQYQPEGLFIDIGSTTCDIIPFHSGDAQPDGVDDYQRQTSRELLYTGAIRTPLIAISQSAPFNGVLTSLAAEVFATTADIWCLLDLLNPASIQDASADGQPWQNQFCASRIARLLGSDFNMATLDQWKQLAQWFAEQQIHQITQAILQVGSSKTELSISAPIIGAGVGRFIARCCAQRLNRPYSDFAEAIAATHTHTSDHAPAVAVALLAHRNLP